MDSVLDVATSPHEVMQATETGATDSPYEVDTAANTPVVRTPRDAVVLRTHHAMATHVTHKTATHARDWVQAHAPTTAQVLPPAAAQVQAHVRATVRPPQDAATHSHAAVRVPLRAQAVTQHPHAEAA